MITKDCMTKSEKSFTESIVSGLVASLFEY